MDVSTPIQFPLWNKVITTAEPLLQTMSTCRQDPIFHAEGDVLTHTRMVVAALATHPNWNDLSRAEQEMLTLAALLHDCGKPETTKTDNGKITSKGHSLAGCRLARLILREAGMTLGMREQVINLIRMHGWPPNLLNQTCPELEVIKAAWLGSNQLLSILAWADMTGRIGAPSNALDAVNLWADIAQEYQCWQQPLPNSNEESKILAFEGKDIRYYLPAQRFKGRITILSGLPGVGKDTWIKKNLPSLPMVSLDAVRTELDIAPTDNQGTVLQEGKEQLRQQLRTGNPFVFNATNLTRDVRTPWIQLARDYGYHVTIVYLEAPIEQVLKQNASRKENKVPENIIHKLVQKLSPPTAEEAHVVNLIANTN